jgi:Flp pilus assembly CpaF family ATPase
MKLDIINIDNVKKIKATRKCRNKHPLLPQAPFNMIISGGTGCGKTNLLLNI